MRTAVLPSAAELISRATEHLQGLHDQKLHAGLSFIDGFDILGQDEYEKSYGDVIDEQSVDLGEGNGLTVRYFKGGDSHVVIDLPDNKYQVLDELPPDSLRRLSDGIAEVIDGESPDADSSDHSFYILRDDAGDLRLYPKGDEGPYFEVSEDDGNRFIDALREMADGYEDNLGLYEDIGVAESLAVAMPTAAELVSRALDASGPAGWRSAEGYDPSQPRVPAGSAAGGQFGPEEQAKKPPKQSSLSYNPRTRKGAGYGVKGGDPQVKVLQELANRLGLTDSNGRKLAVDGKFGPLTTQAAKALQQRLGLEPTGRITQSLLDKIGSAETLDQAKAALAPMPRKRMKPGNRTSEGIARAPRGIARLLEKYNPLQPRDADGQWSDGVPGFASALDKLKLSRRAPAGFVVRSSKKLKTDYADVGIAEIDSPYGPQVRVGVIGNESGKWDAGFTGESRKAELRQEIARKQALMDSDSDDVDDDIEDQISELRSELEDLEGERTAIVSPEAMADFRRQLGEGLEVAKANKAKVDADAKAQDAIDEKRAAIIAEFSDAEMERGIHELSWRLRQAQGIVRDLENDLASGRSRHGWDPEFTAERLASWKEKVAKYEAELAPLLARRAELMPPDARARLEDLDRQFNALNDVAIDDMLTAAEVSAPNGARIRAEIWGSDDEDEQWVSTRLYVLTPGETSDDIDDDYGSFRGLKGLSKLITALDTSRSPEAFDSSLGVHSMLLFRALEAIAVMSPSPAVRLMMLARALEADDTFSRRGHLITVNRARTGKFARKVLDADRMDAASPGESWAARHGIKLDPAFKMDPSPFSPEKMGLVASAKPSRSRAKKAPADTSAIVDSLRAKKSGTGYVDEAGVADELKTLSHAELDSVAAGLGYSHVKGTRLQKAKTIASTLYSGKNSAVAMERSTRQPDVPAAAPDKPLSFFGQMKQAHADAMNADIAARVAKKAAAEKPKRASRAKGPTAEERRDNAIAIMGGRNVWAGNQISSADWSAPKTDADAPKRRAPARRPKAADRPDRAEQMAAISGDPDIWGKLRAAHAEDEANRASAGSSPVSSAVDALRPMVDNPQRGDREKTAEVLGKLTGDQLEEVAQKYGYSVRHLLTVGQKRTQLAENLVGHKLNSQTFGTYEPVTAQAEQFERNLDFARRAQGVAGGGITGRLAAATTRDEARSALAGMKVAELRAVATGLGMRGVGSLGKDDLTSSIVEFTVGNRINSAAIRGL